MPLPHNFTFYISGRDELKYFADKDINYFIGFNHPGQLPEFGYSEESVFEHFGWIPDFCIFEVHDAFTPEHKHMGLKMPDKPLVEEIIRHAEIIKDRLNKGEQINLFSGCAAGISRSTAATYIILCVLLGEWNEREALGLIEQKRSIARPNPLMVSIADRILKRDYKMTGILKNHLDLQGADKDSPLLF